MRHALEVSSFFNERGQKMLAYIHAVADPYKVDENHILYACHL